MSFEGVYILLVILFDVDGEIDYVLLGWYVVDFVGCVFGFGIGGMIGEYYVLSFDECVCMFDMVVVVVGGKMFLIVGINVMMMKEVLCFGCEVKCVGLDVLLVVVLYYV